MLPTTPVGRRLAQLADLRPLEVVDLVADLRQRAGDEREQPDQLGDAVAGGEPRDRRATPRPSRSSTRRWSSGPDSPHADSVPTAPASWPTASRGRASAIRSRWRRTSAIQTAALKPNVIGSPGWPCVRPSMTASRWRRASTTSEASIAAEVALGDLQHPLHHEPGPGVGDVLDRGAERDPLARGLAEVALQHADQAERRVPAPRASPPPPPRDRPAGSARAAISSAAAAGIRPSAPCSAASAPRIETQIRVRASSANSSSRLRRRPEMAEDAGHAAASALARERRGGDLAQRGPDLFERRAPRHHQARTLAPQPALVQAALHQRRPVGRADHARAEVDPRSRLGAVERHVDLARALAADQRPVAQLRRPGVEELALEPAAAARVHVRPGAGRQLAQVDRREVELDRRQVLVEVHHRPRHLEQLRRLGRDHLQHPHAQRRRLDDEVHVLEPALHDGARARPRARAARHLRRVAGVHRRVGDERDLVRPREHAHVRHRRQDLVADRMRDLDDRERARARQRRRTRSADRPAARPATRAASASTSPGASWTLTPRYGRAMKFGPTSITPPILPPGPPPPRGTARAAGARRRRRSARRPSARAAPRS